MTVYKINDCIDCSFVRIPKTLFAEEKYRELSMETKAAYGFLLDRLSLSMRNGWINEKDEVFLIYTREAMAKDLNISYKKATKAFKELVAYDLIIDERPGQGKPNRIYIAKLETTADEAKQYVADENSRTAEMEHLADTDEAYSGDKHYSEPPKQRIRKVSGGKTRPAGREYQDLPKQPRNNTKINNTDFIYTEFNQSLGKYNLNDILEHCEIDLFDRETKQMLYDAIEMLFYSRGMRICNSDVPGDNIRSRLCRLNHEMLESAVECLHRNQSEVVHPTGYLMRVIFNIIADDISIMHVDPYLNHLRSEVRCT